MVPAAFQVPAACEGDAAGLPEQAWGSSDSRHKELYQVEVKGSYEVSLGKGCSVFPCQTVSCRGWVRFTGAACVGAGGGGCGRRGHCCGPALSVCGAENVPRGLGQCRGGIRVPRSRCVLQPAFLHRVSPGHGLYVHRPAGISYWQT